MDELTVNKPTKGTGLMKAFTVAAALSFALVTVPALAQQKPPAIPPAQKPATPPPAAQAAPKPFPEGAKIAYCSLQRVAQDSKAGKAAFDQVKQLQDKLLKGIQDKQKAMEANQALINSPSVAADKKAQLAKEVDRQQVDIQRAQQDAQAEIQELQNELQQSFSAKIAPVIAALAQEKSLHMILVQEDAGIYWANEGLDLTAEIVRRLDGGTTGAPKPPKAQ